MDIQSLKDIENVKKLAKNIWKDIVKVVAEIKFVNKENSLNAFNQYVVSYLKSSYFKFDGRASRQQYWMFQLFVVVIFAILQLVSLLIPFLDSLVVLVEGIVGLLLIIPHVGLAIRRLHDIDLSGLWVLLAFVSFMPFLGIVSSLVLLFLLAIPGDKKTNSYGSVDK